MLAFKHSAGSLDTPRTLVSDAETSGGPISLHTAIVEEEIADECTVPFVPYVGANYCDAKPKILIIGKATYGWGKGDGGQGSGALNDVLGMDDHDLWEHLVELPREFIEGEIIPFYGGEAGHYHG